MLRWICKLLTVSIIGVTLFAPPLDAQEVDVQELKMLEVSHMLKEFHLSKPDHSRLTNGSIEGMIASLEDPYTQYYTDEELRGYLDDLEGRFSGVGIVVGDEAGDLIVYQVFPGSPADLAGIQTGDQLQKVNGKEVAGRPFDEVMADVSGPAGTTVTLAFTRDGQPYEVTAKRKMLNTPQVCAELLSDQIGYIYLATFTEGAYEEFRKELVSLKEQGAKALILDLRDNPGGLLTVANQVVSTFVDQGAFVFVKDGAGMEQRISIIEEIPTETLPLAVIVNEHSASAAEMAAAALQDHRRAAVIGTSTFGKGTVQEIVPLYFGGYLKLTVEEYFTPLRKKVHLVGVTPDQLVESEKEQLQAASNVLHKTLTILATAK